MGEMTKYNTELDEEKILLTDEDMDGKLETAYVDSDGNGVVDKTIDLNGAALQAKTEELDTTGDGAVDTIAIDTTGDGNYDTLMSDEDGDGKYDTALVDTTGDGVLNETIELK